MSPDPMADLLTDTLRERTERAEYPTTSMATVAARARHVRARRRRRTAVLAAAAAAAVLATGAAVLWPGPQHHSSEPAQQPSGHGPVIPDLEKLPQGPKPHVDYLHGRTYVAADGTTASSSWFTRAGVVARVSDGYLIAWGEGVRTRIALVAPGQRTRQLGCGSPRFALSADGTETAYWVADRCAGPAAGKLWIGANNTMGNGAGSAIATPVAAEYLPIGFLPGGGVVVSSTGGGGSGTFVVSSDGTRRRIPGLSDPQGAAQSSDLVSGFLGDDRRAGVVVDASTGALSWRAESYTLGQFSTDGRYVFGLRARDGSPWDTVSIFDASSGVMKAAVRIPVDTDSVGQIGWDRGDSLLMSIHDSLGEALVRLDVNGSVTRATAVTRGGAGYVLSTRP